MALTNPLPRTRLQPRKLLLSKWTAVVPQQRERHFLVTGVVEPQQPGQPVEQVHLQAVLTRRTRTLDWRELTDPAVWRQGWS